MKNEQVYESMKKYAAMLAADGYLECGYIAVKADDGLYITTPDADFKELKEEQVAFVTDKSVEELEGNFRAAAVLAIVDSKSILEFSAKKVTLPPILEDMAQINGVSVRAAKQNTAAEVVNALSGARNACFLPDAGAVVTGRTLAEVYPTAISSPRRRAALSTSMLSKPGSSTWSTSSNTARKTSPPKRRRSRAKSWIQPKSLPPSTPTS